MSLAILAFIEGCGVRSDRVDSINELPYPSCDANGRTEERLLEGIDLRAGPSLRERWAVEHFRWVQRPCVSAALVRIERGYEASDIEVLYDLEGHPLRAWRRVTLPGVEAEDGDPEIRRYELRTDPVNLKQRSPGGKITLRTLRGPRPTAVIGMGRAALTVWIRRARLGVRQQVREWVLDLEAGRLDEVTLRRHEDITRPDLGRVRVYSVFGRDSIFTDETDSVVGDLAGLLPFDRVRTPAPHPMKSYGAADPAGTP